VVIFHQHHRQTDGPTTCDLKTTFCTVVHWVLKMKLEGAQRVHISAKLHCLRPDRNFKFHLCPETRIAYLYIFVVIVAMTTQVITSPHVTACCCDEAKTLEMVLHFCTFLLNPHFDLEPHYIVRKPIKRRFQRYIVHTEIFSTFHAPVKYIYQQTIRHSTHSNQWD